MEIQPTLLFIVASINSILSLFVLFGKRNMTNVVYAVFVLFASLWSIALGFFILESDLARSLYIANFFYFSAAGIPLFFLYFSFIFPDKAFRATKKYLLVLSLPLVLITVLLLLDKNFFITEVFNTDWGKDVVINKINYIIYICYFLLFTGFAFYNLVTSYIQSSLKGENREKSELKLIIWGTAIGFIFGMIFDLFLPLFGNYRYIYIGPLFSFSMVLAIAYSITKYNLFNIKVFATETIVFILWVTILIRTILAETLKEQFINIAFLIVAIILGIFLIKSIIKEIAQREKIESLAKDLESANKGLESINTRLEELDQMKSEFLSLATHQIRAPLTAVKGYASLLLEGDYGEISEEVRGAVKIIGQSCENLVVIVNEFLDISRIEQGKMKYTLTNFDLKALSVEILEELKPNIEHAGLTYDFHAEEGEYWVHADQGKLQQVIGNLIDNAIKYTPTGGMSVNLKKEGNVVHLSIKDTGIGISSEDIPKLFNKFTRAKDANKQNVIGTGLGLYVAKQMLEAQGGKIWIESEGVGRGTTFIVELPKNQ